VEASHTGGRGGGGQAAHWGPFLGVNRRGRGPEEGHHRWGRLSGARLLRLSHTTRQRATLAAAHPALAEPPPLLGPRRASAAAACLPRARARSPSQRHACTPHCGGCRSPVPRPLSTWAQLACVARPAARQPPRLRPACSRALPLSRASAPGPPAVRASWARSPGACRS
jgi:hypothetical protein